MPDEALWAGVLVMAPFGTDAANLAAVLSEAEVVSCICGDVAELERRIDAGCAGLILTEESLNLQGVSALTAALGRQPPWSDLPIIIITTSAGRSHSTPIQLMSAHANVNLIERPLRKISVVSAVRSAIRARQRQYQTRDLLEERAELLASLEIRVAERTASLQQMVEELESFSYSVSHDLRAPLRALMVYVDILAEECSGELSPEARLYLGKIGQGARRLDRLTFDLLTYTRVSRATIALEPLDLDEQVLGIIDSYPSLVVWRNNIAVKSPLGRVMGHPPSLMQCLSNLLENGIKFAQPGQPPHLEVATEERENWVRLLVRDNGVGIEPAYFEKIFGMFERLTPSTHEGTGIGLAIVKKAAERMGGSVGVDSVPGTGSVFWIDLPAAPRLPADLPGAELAAARPGA